ncbi:hypothetical protein Tco_1538746 [Tanacetum coccineum]
MKVTKNPVQPELAAGGVAFSQISGSVAYFPCLRNGIPKGAAILIAFFMSAVFYEVAGKALFMAHVEGQLKITKVAIG